MKNKIISAVEKNRDIIIEAQNYIWANPETGYKEKKTSKYLEGKFEDLGYSLIKADDITGFYTVLDTGRPGPEVLVLGELDALLCPEHPDADSATGAAHCCGHSAQCAALLGIAAALKEPDIFNCLSGRIRLCAVPAEELIELEYRTELKNKGKIHYMTGKQEFLYRGYFDGVDMGLMVHTSQAEIFVATGGAVGCTAKRVVYKGASAHAGGNPWDGCNALYAATLGLSAINSIRETFKESDIIRVHPIITQGGGAVNAIPDRVTLESFVRGSSFEAINNANERVNRALCGAALSLGANVDIEDTHGYGPLRNDKGMTEIARDAAEVLELPFAETDEIGSGSTDMGDLSCIMPVVHPYAPGAAGISHGKSYKIVDSELACVASAKWQLCMLMLLLQDGADRAKQIISEFKPIFNSKGEYFGYLSKISCSGDRIAYTDGRAEVKLK